MLERVAAVAVAVPFVIGTMSASAAGGNVVFRFQDPAIVEASGLVVQRGLFVTTNDSGDSGRVFVVDPADGRTVGVTSWPGSPEDVEALAPAGRDGVWAGDIGDNAQERSSISVTRLPVAAEDNEVQGETYELTYPDSPQDAESLLADPRSGRLLVASKGLLGGSLYAAPRQLSADGPNQMRKIGDILPIATDGAFFPDGRHLVLRNYGRAVVYTYPGLDEVGELDLPAQQQGEAIAIDDDSRVYVTSEGVNAPVLEVPLPAAIRAEVSPSPSASASPSPSPSTPPGSREGKELPEAESQGREPWQWLLGTVLAVGAIAVLVRAIRPR
jgi:hypothetical protein